MSDERMTDEQLWEMYFEAGGVGGYYEEHERTRTNLLQAFKDWAKETDQLSDMLVAIWKALHPEAMDGTMSVFVGEYLEAIESRDAELRDLRAENARLREKHEHNERELEACWHVLAEHLGRVTAPIHVNAARKKLDKWAEDND